MKRQTVLVAATATVTVLFIALFFAQHATAAAPDIKALALCRIVRGDGVCLEQPYGAYIPGSRLWARAALDGLANDGQSADLELTIEIQAPDGQVAYRSLVKDDPQTIPQDRSSAYAAVFYDIPPDAPTGNYVLRLLLHDQGADAHVTAEAPFSVGSKEAIPTQYPVELSAKNLAAQITAHGFALANQVAEQQAPQGQLFLVVDTTWRNLLTDRVYGVRLEMLAFATVDGQIDYPYADLGRYLDGALPTELYIAPGQYLDGLLTFVIPAECTSVALRYRDDVIGQGDVVIPLFDLAMGDEIDFPEPGVGAAATVPVGAGGPVELDEVEPNNAFRAATVLPAAESLIINGMLPERTDQDWYQLTVNSSEPMAWQIELGAVPGVNFGLGIHQESGGRLLGIDDGGSGEGESVSDLALAPGTYLVTVYARDGQNPDQPYELLIHTTGPTRADQEYEINNNQKVAQPIQLGQPVNGKMSFKQDQDWFLLHLEEDTPVALTLSPPPGIDLFLALHDGDGRRESLLNVGKKGEPEQRSAKLTAGDHYMVVTGDVDPRRSYVLSVMPLRQEGLNQDLEDNNQAAQANVVEDGAIVDGSFQGNDEDWFVIDNPSGEERVAKALLWNTSAQGCQLALYSPSGAKISEGNARTTYAYALVPPGTTYVQAKGNNTNYLLTVWFDLPGPVDDPRQAAQIGLNSLLSSAVDWQTQHNCFGCHVQSMAVMGSALGKENGYRVNSQEVDALVRLMQSQQQSDYDYGGAGPLSSLAINGMALSYHEQLVASTDPDSLSILEETAQYLVDEQRSDGRWTHSRIETPVQQGDIQITADAIQILRRAPGDWAASIERAAGFLAQAEPATTQDHAYRAIGLVLSENPAYEGLIQDQAETLLSLQNADGGWSELPTLDSSPYATGQVLYALKLSGLSVSDTRFNEGVRWLVERQEWSGEWQPANTSAHNPARVSLFPPTMWATIGLAGTLEMVEVDITSPQADVPVEGPTTIVATALTKGVTPVSRVEFYVDDTLVCLDEDVPYECVWEAPIPAVAHKIKAVAIDTGGRTGTSLVLTPPLQGDGTIQVTLAPDAPRPVPANIEIVLDASGSMWARMDGQPRIEIARQVLDTLFGELPDGVNIALRVYGHQYDYREENCTDSVLLVPLGPIDRDQLTTEVNALNPQGMTPIGYALQQVAGDLATAQDRKVVVLVSDGEETCGADPCKVADTEAASLGTQIHVVGFAVEDPAIAGQLACIAEVTGGSYLSANNAEQLIAALREAVTVEYVIYDRDSIEVRRGVVGGEPISVPAGTYRIEVLTRTPLVAEQVLVRGETQTALQVTAAGSLDLVSSE